MDVDTSTDSAQDGVLDLDFETPIISLESSFRLLSSEHDASIAVDFLPTQDVIPHIQDIDTPNISFDSASEQSQSSCSTSGGSDTVFESPDGLLRKLRIKNINKVMIGTLNINSMAPKFDQLREVIGNHLDILTIQETKLDSSFPTGQFLINGYSEPYRLDRNRNGGGVMIYVREDMPSKLLNRHTFTETIEGLFIEVNLRKTRLLFFGSYRSDHAEFGVSTDIFFNQISLALDVYSNYDKFLLAGDFNTEDTNSFLSTMLKI